MKHNHIDYSDYYAEGGKVDNSIPLKIRKELYDKEGERRIDERAIEVLTRYAENLPQTKDLNTNKITGDYYPERKKLHAKIMDSFKEDLICIQNDEPIAILMGGSPASGKSTFLRKYAPYLLKEEILKVDADEIRAKLPEYKGWNATQTHQETKDIVNTLLSNRTIGIPCKYDIIYDGTMNSAKSYYPLIALLKKLGYKVFIVYIDKVEEEVIKKRALERYKKSGRFVPMAVIDDFFTRGKSALNELKDKTDGYMVVDGSDGDYTVIERGGIKLPKRRAYSKLGVPIAQLEKERKMEMGGDVFTLNAKNPKSISGRNLTPLPKGNYLSNRTALNSDKKWNQWLYENALEEVKSDSYRTTLVKALNPSKLSPADKDFLNLVLFDQTNCKISYEDGGITESFTPDYLKMFLGK
jgi:predicted ABC-type ATPase